MNLSQSNRWKRFIGKSEITGDDTDWRKWIILQRKNKYQTTTNISTEYFNSDDDYFSYKSRTRTIFASPSVINKQENNNNF